MSLNDKHQLEQAEREVMDDYEFQETDLGPLGKYFELWDMEADDGYGELVFEGCIHWNSPDSTSFEIAELIIY